MDFRSLLQSMTSLSEAETKDTKTGRVHKGDYGTSHEAGDEGVKKQETQRGRGRPKKDADETGEVKKYDTKTLGDVFGAGKKPSKEVGTVSKKHSLKEYIDSVEESIAEGETIEKKGGRVHKGSYGTSYEAGDEGVKKVQTQRGRGRPKKDADETGEVKKYDTKSLGNVFGGGKAPKKPVGKVSASNKLKESAQFEAVMEGMFGGVDHSNVAANLGKLAKVIKSVQTPEQFAVAQKYAQRMSGTIMNHQHDKMGFGSGIRANMGVMRAVQSDLKAKAAELGIEYNQLEETDQIQIKPASQTNTQVIQQGNKTLGTVTNPQLANQIKTAIGQGQMSLAGDDEQQMTEVSKGLATKAFAKRAANAWDLADMATSDEDYDDYAKEHNKAEKTYGRIGQRWGKSAQTDASKAANREVFGHEMNEGKDEGKPGKNFAKIAKSAGEKYGSKAAGERVAGAVRNKLKAQGKLEEAKPDFLDVDKDGDKKESFKKAVKDKKKVAEGRDQEASEYLDEKIARILAREKPGMKAVSSNDEFYGAIYHELIACGLTPKAARYKVSYDEDFIADVASAYAHYQQNPSLDEGSIDDFRIDGVKPTNNFAKTGTSMAQPKGTPTMANRPVAEPTPFGTDPIQATTDRAINFISGLRKPSNPFSESTTMKDMQVESWSKQLDSLLNEGITVSSSTGQQGQPDSVSVTASDNDAQALLTVLRQAGIGGFGAGEQPQATGYGVVSQGEEEATGTGTEPQDAPAIVGDGDDMMALIKKMAGIDATGADTYSDYADEEGSEGSEEVGTLEPADSGEEEGSDEDSEETSSDEEDSEEESDDEEQTDEGNAFTGKLKQTQQGGEFKMGDKSYKDTSSIEEGGFDPERFGSDGSGFGGGAGGGDIQKCHECGGSMTEAHHCGEEQVEENYANSAEDPADSELMKLKALLSMGNDLHKQKSSQAIGNPVRVAESKQMIADWKKLSGI